MEDLDVLTIDDLKGAIKHRETVIMSYARIYNFLNKSQSDRLEKYADEIDEMKAEIKRRKEKQNG